jgi:hypothetical protein
MSVAPVAPVATPKAETPSDLARDHQNPIERGQFTPKKRARSSALGTKHACARRR